MSVTGERTAVKIPHDVLNEQVLIAAALTDHQACVELAKRVRAEHFQDAQHALAWTFIQRCTDRNVVASPEIVSHMSGGTVELIYLHELIETHPQAPPNLRYHIEALAWDVSRARAVQGPVTELLHALQDPSTPAERVRALSKQVGIAFEGASGRPYLRDGQKLSAQHGATLRSRIVGQAVYPFGIKELDFYGDFDQDENGKSLKGVPLMVPGVAPGKITVVTAISGGGKSTLTALLALHQARMYRRILYGAWEMGAEETLELMACASAQIQRSRARTGKLTQAEAALLQTRMEEISKFITFMDMPFLKQRGSRVTHDEVLDQIHGYIADSGAEVVIFDLWRRAFRKMKDESEEAEALYRQQAIADETKCHIILVQQQRLKDIETRANPRPTREGIKGSSTWVDVADNVLGVYLPQLMKQVGKNKMEILVLKQRFGRWPVAIEFDWDWELCNLTNGHLVAYNPGSEQAMGPTKESKGRAFAKGQKQ